MSRSRARKKSQAPGRGAPPPSDPHAAPAPTSWLGGGEWKPALLVVGVALAACARGLLNDFAMDDFHLILSDPRAHTLLDPAGVFASPYWPEPFNRDLYRPFATLSFALQWQLGGGSPLVFRVVSYLLYASVSLGVLALGRRLLPAWAALAVALLFAAHPVHVEAVALGVNQSEQWVALLALLAVVRYIDLRRRGWPNPLDWTLLGVVYSVAFLFKEHALAIPGLFLAAELTLFRDVGARERMRRLWPGFAALAALGVAFLALRARILGSFVGSFTAPALVGQGIGGRTLTMLQVVPEWLRLLLWPAHLQGDYSPAVLEQASGWGSEQSAGAVLLLALVVLGWRTRKAAPAVAFGLLWMGAALLPVSNILVATGILLAERTLYLPSVGFLLALGSVAATAASAERTRFARLAKAALAVLVLAGVLRSAARQGDWKDHLHFWRRTAEDAPLSHKAHYAYGQLLYGAGDREAGLREYYTAVALAPSEYWLQRELGDLFRMAGECEPALYWYAESLKIEPEQPTVRLSRISCLVQLGRLEEARREADLTVTPTPPSGPR